MTRTFLRLYLLLVLPLILLALLPINPISIVGNWWWERTAQEEFGAIYPLIMEELERLPQEQWQDKVADISQHFAFSLSLKKSAESGLKKKVLERLEKQGYALSFEEPDAKLVHKVQGTDYLLLSGLYDYDTDIKIFEKQTRGFRYLLNKKIFNSSHPEKEFERIKDYFEIHLGLKKTDDFQKDEEIMQGLLKDGLFMKKNGTRYESYVLSNNKKYVVSIISKDNLIPIREFYKYFSLAVPALLLALGAFFWLFLFRKELITLKKASYALGKGELQTRTHLSKNSTLYELSNSFNQMAGRIQQLLDDHKDLTNAVSHELKTPISRLRFALEMQQESQSEEEEEHYTQKIESNIQFLQDLIDELLGYTRMQREQSLDLQLHDVKAWLLHEIDLFSDYHPDIHFKLDIQIDKRIRFDKLQMTRALSNLLDNAVKHTQSIVKVSIKMESNEVILAVEDNGSGISEKECEKVFEPFTRLDKSRQHDKDSKGGYGLGLAIVKSIVKLHQGQVACQESSLGGAAFIVRWRNESV